MTTEAHQDHTYSTGSEPRPDNHLEPSARRLPGAATYLTLVTWVGLIVAVIGAGWYEVGAGEVPIALIGSVAGPVVGFSVFYRRSSGFREYILDLDLRLVLAAQLWRVIGAAFLFALAFDRLPSSFAFPAGIGDVLTGVVAIGVLISLGNGTLSRARLYAFTALGIGDFLTAIVIGLALRPAELDLWPLIVFPTLAVPFFAVMHLIAVLQSRNGWEERMQVHAA